MFLLGTRSLAGGIESVFAQLTYLEAHCVQSSIPLGDMVVPPDDASETLALGSSAPYQMDLASRLLSAGMLRRVLAPGLFLEIRDPAHDGSLQVIKRFPANKFLNRVIWGTWGRLPRKIRPKPSTMVTG